MEKEAYILTREQEIFEMVTNSVASLQAVVDAFELKDYTIVLYVSKEIEKLNLKSQKKILNQIYISKKFDLFFNIAKELLLNKEENQIKKQFGVRLEYIYASKTLFACPLLLEEVRKTKRKWQNTEYLPKSRRKNFNKSNILILA
jgi:hypothetical protein